MNIKVTSFTVSEKSINTGSGNSGLKKVNIRVCSMYVLFADNVACPMIQHYDSGDSQIINPSIPSLTLYELSHCAS